MVIFFVAATLFAANFLLGVLVQFRIVDTKPFRWLHHALFFLVAASAALAAAWGIFSGAAYGWLLLPVLLAYFFLPRVRAGTFGHAALASFALIFYAAGFAFAAF
jgi:isoprenylcysteine carboxyl methyltransferase (ICMT) family protein YpbQ